MDAAVREVRPLVTLTSLKIISFDQNWNLISYFFEHWNNEIDC